ncbi:MAG: methyl-accepting chemotaxis protein [Thermodesulfobacteriota bacterium]
MKLLSNLKVGTRMAIGFGVLTLIIVLTGGLGYFAAKESSKTVTEIANVRLPSLTAVLTMQYEFENVITAQRTLLNPENDMQTRKKQYERIKQARDAYVAAMERYEKLPHTAKEAKQWKLFKEHLGEWKKVNDEFFEISKDFEQSSILNPNRLMNRLQMFRGDHYILLDKVLEYIYSDKSFEGGGDPTACNFGFWLDDFSTENSNLNEIIEKLRAPHTAFHESIQKIKNAVAENNKDLAIQIFNNETQVYIQEIMDGFSELIDEGFNSYMLLDEMSSLAMVDAVKAQEDTLEHLNNVKNINLQIAENERIEAQKQAESNMKTSVAALFAGFLFAVLFGIIITRSIVKPLMQSSLLFKAISEGDMTKNVPQNLLEQKDELGEMGRQINEMTTALRQIFTNLNKGVSTLASSSTELSSVSDETAKGAKASSKSSDTVAAATEELTASAESMAEKMENSAGNLNSVASAMEEMTSTISEIADNTSSANKSTEESVKQAENFAKVMKELGEAATEIGKVTETISNISDQTNLLALNATIEAARAGEAGKGFAVVAGEIKDLASQTASATEDISKRIEGIQSASEKAEADIGSIVKGIQNVNDIVSAIASAIEEQTSAITEVSSNVNTATDMVNEASNQSSEMKNVAGDISKDIMDVSTSSAEVEKASAQVQETVQELSQLSEEIEEMLKGYKV